MQTSAHLRFGSSLRAVLRGQSPRRRLPRPMRGASDQEAAARASRTRQGHPPRLDRAAAGAGRCGARLRGCARSAAAGLTEPPQPGLAPPGLALQAACAACPSPPARRLGDGQAAQAKRRSGCCRRRTRFPAPAVPRTQRHGARRPGRQGSGGGVADHCGRRAGDRRCGVAVAVRAAPWSSA